MTVVIGNQKIPVEVRFKRMKKVILRWTNNHFIVSAPKRTSLKWIRSQVLLYGPALQKKHALIPPPMTPLGMYLFGTWYSFSALRVTFPQIMKDKISLQLNDRIIFKELFFSLLNQRVNYYVKELHISTNYLVRVREMKTRLGSNAKKTKRLTFALKLIHYAWPIIDAVIVHELIHDRHFDHSPRFYQALREAYPRYDEEHGKILKGQYQ
jgi:predicted metal-dependent hydrolase